MIKYTTNYKDLQLDLMALGEEFRRLVMQECNWSGPSFYRKLRLVQMSSVEKCFILKVADKGVLRLLHKYRHKFTYPLVIGPPYTSCESYSLINMSFVLEHMYRDFRNLLRKEMNCSNSTLYRLSFETDIEDRKMATILQVFYRVLTGALLYCQKCREQYGMVTPRRRRRTVLKKLCKPGPVTVRQSRLYTDGSSGSTFSN